MRVLPVRIHLSTSCKKATRLRYCDLDPSFFMRVGLMKYGLGHQLSQCIAAVGIDIIARSYNICAGGNSPTGSTLLQCADKLLLL